METWVLDCSCLAPLFLSDEERDDVEELLKQAAAGSLRIILPELLHVEILNVLVTAIRRKRITAGDAERTLHWLRSMPWETAESPDDFARLRILHFAHKHRLSAYDAVYLELADRTGAYLKSRDEAILALKPVFSWIRR